MRNAKDVLSALKDAGNTLNKSSLDTFSQDDPVVSVARDIAQGDRQRLGGDGGHRGLTAKAKHPLLTGRTDQAVSMLSQAHDRARH